MKLGTRPKLGDERDAIHIAIAPVVAMTSLSPGEHVQLHENEQAYPGPNPIGIVDPYLKHSAAKGETFWLCLYPETFTSLTHHWTHPAFNNKSESEAWLREFAKDLEIDYDYMIETIKSGHTVCLDIDLPDRLSTDERMFWLHFSILTGQANDPDERLPFSCSC